MIDPLIQATYLGGSNEDYINAMVVTADAVYVAGDTYSTNFPGTSGGAQTGCASCPNDYDAFVAKLSLDLKTLTQASYLGGNENDYATALSLSSSAVYVTGVTTSRNFPSTSGGAQASCALYLSGGNYDCYDEVFVAKLSLDLKSLAQSTYLGGTREDIANAIAVSSDAVYVAGSASRYFPGTTGGAQAACAINTNSECIGDAFVAKLSLDLKSLTQSTYLGGRSVDTANALAVTNSAVYVVGDTLSVNFPAASGGAQASSGGYWDGFVAKLSLDLKTLTQASYLGGSDQDHAKALILSNSAVYVAGYSDYSDSDFPGTSGGAITTSYSGFVSKLNLDLKSLVQSTYMGRAYALAISNNAVYVAGYTNSGDFPGTSGGAQAACALNDDGSCRDAFVAKLALDLKSLIQSTFLGGSASDSAGAIAVTNNAVYVAGGTASSNFPGTSGGAQASISGNACGGSPNLYPCSDGFVAKLSLDLRAISAPSVSTDAPSVITQTSAKLNGTVNANGAATTVTFDFGPTTAYGQSIAAVPAAIAATVAATAVSANKTGLTCGITYHYRVKAVNSIGTTNGSDKAFTTPVCIPDFIITNVVLTPATPVLNTNFSIAVTLKNQGSLAKDGGQLRLWLNQPTAQTCAASGGDKNLAVGTMAVGASKTLTFTGLNLASIGMRTLRTFVDATCATAESNETNNQWIKSYRITGTGTRQADLSVTAIVLTPTTPVANGIFSAAVTIQNLGTAASTNAFLDVWANRATAVTCGADGNAWADVGAIAAGATTTVTVSGIPAGAAGSKTLRAFVDSWCEFVESNETNNQLTKTYTVP